MCVEASRSSLQEENKIQNKIHILITSSLVCIQLDEDRPSRKPRMNVLIGFKNQSMSPVAFPSGAVYASVRARTVTRSSPSASSSRARLRRATDGGDVTFALSDETIDGGGSDVVVVALALPPRLRRAGVGLQKSPVIRRVIHCVMQTSYER